MSEEPRAQVAIVQSPAGLTPQQEWYCAERAMGAVVKDAAETVGISRPRAYHWEKEVPAISARINDLLAPIQDEVMRIFRLNAVRAARRIVELQDQAKGMSIVVATNLKACELTLRYAGLEPAAKLNLDGDLRHSFTIERIVYSSPDEHKYGQELDVVATPVAIEDAGARDEG